MYRQLKRITLFIATLTLCMLAWSWTGRAPPADQEQNTSLDKRLAKLKALVPKQIAGRSYSIASGTTPGTYVVKWGDDQIVWEPKPWMEPAYRALGPYYNLQWTQEGLPYPWEVPLEKRDKIPVRELPDRCITYPDFNAQVTNGWDSWGSKVYLPSGKLRSETKGFEFFSSAILGHGKRYLSGAATQDVARLYLWEDTNPEELRGEGGITTVFKDPNLVPEDTLYLPQVRKMRRLAGSVPQQYFPGGIFRYEDTTYTQALPQLNYKLVGFKLLDLPALRGYGANDYPEYKRVAQTGDVAAIIEVTPKPGISWWYAKRLIYCGLLTMWAPYTKEFDSQDHWIRYRTLVPMTGSVLHLGDPKGPPAPDWWTIWGSGSAVELTSGFAVDSWIITGGYNYPGSPSMFTSATLYAQPMTLDEWLR